jgi:hypothetical protein
MAADICAINGTIALRPGCRVARVKKDIANITFSWSEKRAYRVRRVSLA